MLKKGQISFQVNRFPLYSDAFKKKQLGGFMDWKPHIYSFIDVIKAMMINMEKKVSFAWLRPKFF